MRASIGATLLSCLCVTGCYSGVEQQPDNPVFRGQEENNIFPNGIFRQGIFRQGIFRQGIFEQGIFRQGIFQQGIFRQGSEIDGVWVEGTFNHGETMHDLNLVNGMFSVDLDVAGQTVHMQGLDFIGTVFHLDYAYEENGQEIIEPVTMRFDNIYPSPEDPGVHYYDVAVLNPETNAWESMCANGGPVIPLNGIWDETGARVEDEDGISFSCPDGVLAKCVNWGYVPWETAEVCYKKKKKKGKKKKKLVCEDVNLRDYHQACTRMARADYCGDGVPHTINGTLIDIADNLNPPIQQFESDWEVEAEWTPDGASCITDNLRAMMLHEEDELPACFDEISTKGNCGKLKKNRAQLATRFEMPDIDDDNDDE